MTAHTDFFENRLIDFVFRGQAFGLANSTAAAGSGPTNLYVGLLSSAGNDASPGTELSGSGYARVAVPCTLASWAGTQGAGTVAVSSGTSGTTSNNNAITFPQPTALWAQAVGWALFDAATGGSAIIRAALETPRTGNVGEPALNFPAGTLSYQNDN